MEKQQEEHSAGGVLVRSMYWKRCSKINFTLWRWVYWSLTKKRTTSCCTCYLHQHELLQLDGIGEKEKCWLWDNKAVMGGGHISLSLSLISLRMSFKMSLRCEVFSSLMWPACHSKATELHLTGHDGRHARRYTFISYYNIVTAIFLIFQYFQWFIQESKKWGDGDVKFQTGARKVMSWVASVKRIQIFRMERATFIHDVCFISRESRRSTMMTVIDLDWCKSCAVLWHSTVLIKEVCTWFRSFRTITRGPNMTRNDLNSHESSCFHCLSPWDSSVSNDSRLKILT